MFINDNIIYLQMQKTGCTHITYLLSNIVGGREKDKHSWLTRYDYNKYIIGSIRNPWDWYVSLWAFGCLGKGGEVKKLTKLDLLYSILYFDIFELLNELKKPKEMWKKLYKDPYDVNNFQDWLKQIYNSERKIDLKEKYRKHLVSDHIGFMTHRYCMLYLKYYYDTIYINTKIKSLSDLYEYDKKNNIIDFIIKNESLEQDLINTLKKCGYDVEDKVEYIYSFSKKKINTSNHKHYAYYYNEETKNMVYEKEKYLIEKYKYKF